MSEDFIDKVRRQHPVTPSEAMAFFTSRPAIAPQFLLGPWTGTPVCTGNPTVTTILQNRWAGKHFRSVDDVDPMVCYNDQGRRWANPHWGAARIREISFQGVVSAAMVYNTRPVIDYFRHVDANTVIGAMDNVDECVPGWDSNDRFYFVLERGVRE